MSRVAIDLGFIQIYWYSIMIALGLFVGVSMILMEAKKQKLSEDDFVNLVKQESIGWFSKVSMEIS